MRNKQNVPPVPAELSFLQVTCGLILFFFSTKYHQNIVFIIYIITNADETKQMAQWPSEARTQENHKQKAQPQTLIVIRFTEQTQNPIQRQEGEITAKVRQPELSFLYATRRLVLFYVSTRANTKSRHNNCQI